MRRWPRDALIRRRWPAIVAANADCASIQRRQQQQAWTAASDVVDPTITFRQRRRQQIQLRQPTNAAHSNALLIFL